MPIDVSWFAQREEELSGPPSGYLTVIKPNWAPQIGPHDCTSCAQDLGDAYDDFLYCPYCGEGL